MVQLRTSLRIFISAVFMLTAALSTAQDANQQTQHPNPPSNAEAAASRPSSSLSSNLGVYVFPTKNQTPQQQSTDEAGCFSWAEEQTGINPMENESFTAQQQQQAQQSPVKSTKGSGAKGAAGGAAGGAAIGAIAGNAGEGAAIGATAGAIHGRRQPRKAEKKAEEQQQQAAHQQQQAQAQVQAQTADRKKTYNKAFSARMEGKGYTVK